MKNPFFRSTTWDNTMRSYGIIAYCRVENTIKYLICEQRSSYDYLQFVRGFYTEEDLPKFIFFMTDEERKFIEKYSFDELWRDVWLRQNKVGYFFAKKKYDENIENSLSLIKISKGKNSSRKQWMFPKGRLKSSYEPAEKCAIREFREECAFDRKTKINIRMDLPLVEEMVIGTDDKKYYSNYYIAKMDFYKTILPKNKAPKYSLKDHFLSSETSRSKWITLDEADEHLSKMRCSILGEVDKLIVGKSY